MEYYGIQIKAMAIWATTVFLIHKLEIGLLKIKTYNILFCILFISNVKGQFNPEYLFLENMSIYNQNEMISIKYNPFETNQGLIKFIYIESFNEKNKFKYRKYTFFNNPNKEKEIYRENHCDTLIRYIINLDTSYYYYNNNCNIYKKININRNNYQKTNDSIIYIYNDDDDEKLSKIYVYQNSILVELENYTIDSLGRIIEVENTFFNKNTISKSKFIITYKNNLYNELIVFFYEENTWKFGYYIYSLPLPLESKREFIHYSKNIEEIAIRRANECILSP